MKAKILVIEDEEAINELICMNLQAAGYETTSFFDGDEAARGIEAAHVYDLALVDVMLPGKDGFALMEDMRRFQIPVIYLTARNDIASKIQGLRGGGEDYMVKPFEMLELLARMEKILERRGGKKDEIHFQDIIIYPKRHVVLKQGKEIVLTPMEFDCLILLIKNKNMALTREQLLKTLWGSEFEGETRTIDVHIARIRKKLGLGDIIRTIPRIGYRLEVDE